jgi:hypothetical protein
VVSFTPRPLYPQGKSPWYPLDRRLVMMMMMMIIIIIIIIIIRDEYQLMELLVL